MSSPTTTSRSPLPSISEGILLTIYPLILILGSLYSVTISSSASPYNPILQSHEPATAPSYFARKDNFFNVVFVKRGWAWTTVTFFLIQFFVYTSSSSAPRSSSSNNNNAVPRVSRGLARFAAVTTVWILVTQWSFGPPLIDRTFSLSGGTCDLHAVVGENMTPAQRIAVPKQGVTPASDISSGRACRAVGGTWKGGHDISGHVFLLILGSGSLLFEALPEIRRWTLGENGEKGTRIAGPLGNGAKAALAVSGLKLWMLLMTAVFFHTWQEKLTGFVVAMTALWVVYILPRSVPVLRAIFGRPE